MKTSEANEMPMTNPLLLKAADEAFKPVSSAVNVLRAPKIKRIEDWAKERDIVSRSDSKKLHQQLDEYLKRISKRVSKVTTIVFPQEPLSLVDIYEPLSLIRRFDGSRILTERLCLPGTQSYIVDNAGMGKSTFVKHLILEQITSSERIPVFLELRRIPIEQTLMDALAQELDSLTSIFDREVLLLLAQSGRFIVILDGFDELPKDDMPLRARQIEDFANKGDECTILVTSRPETELPPMPQASAISINPLTQEQAISLIRRYDKAVNIDVGERLIQQIDSVPERFLQTPLMVALLYRTFYFNGAISTRITSFYDEMYSALYKGHDRSKAGFSRDKHSGLDFDDFRRVLRGLAFLMIAKQVNSFPSDTAATTLVEEAVKYTSVNLKSNTDFLRDLLLTVPMMVRDGGEIRFIHKTIVEFFAAEYLAYSCDSDDLLSKILGGALKSRFIEVFNFLSELSPSLFRRSVVAPLASEIIESEICSQDEILDTLLFLGNKAEFAIFKHEDIYREEVTTEGGNKIGYMIPKGLVWTARSLTFSQGRINGEHYDLCIALGESNRSVSSSAWSLVTDMEVFDPSVMHYPFDYSISSGPGQNDDTKNPYDFTDLIAEFGVDKWLPLVELNRLDIHRLKGLRRSLIRALLSANAIAGLFDGSIDSVRFKSKSRAEQLLTQVKEDDKSRTDLDSLLNSMS